MRVESFDLQGHRGARGLKPENTLPSFETAFDVGVTTVETDLHLTRDGIPVLIHDHYLGEKICRRLSSRPEEVPDPAERPWVSRLSLAQVRCYRADLNPDPARFPDQDNRATPLAQWFAERHVLDAYTVPTLADLLAFTEAYASEAGERVGKTAQQREHARRVRFDLELKRVPFRPETIGDSLSGELGGLLEKRVVDVLRGGGVVDRTTVRSFDHRCVRAVRSLQPDLTTAVLVAGTAPVDPAQLAILAEAQIYGPDFQFLDEQQVRQAHAQGIRVVPWTVNEPEDWQRLFDWGVDGITTDFPDRLAAWLQGRVRLGPVLEKRKN